MTCEICTNKECKCFNNFKDSPVNNNAEILDITDVETPDTYNEEVAFVEALNMFLNEWKRVLSIEVPIAEIPELVKLALNASRADTVLKNNTWLKSYKLPE